MKYEFLEDVAIADIAFRAEGRTIEELFANCALALTDTMADPKKIAGKEKKIIRAGGLTEGEMLYNFLSELVYVKDVDGLIFKKFNVKIAKERLEAECSGATLEGIGRKNLRNDVKAITMHMFGIKKEGGRYIATVVVDI